MDLKNIKTVFVNTRTENSIKTLTPCVTCMHLSIKKKWVCVCQFQMSSQKMLINIKSWRKSWMNNTTWTKYKCFLFNELFCNEMEDRHLLKRLHQMVHLKLNCFSLVDILKVECVWLNAIKYIINSPITFRHDFSGYSVSRSQKFFFTQTWIAHCFLLFCIHAF